MLARLNGRVVCCAAAATLAALWLALKLGLVHLFLRGILRWLLTSALVVGSAPWMLSTRQGTAAIARALTALLPGRVVIKSLQLSWTAPAVVKGVTLFETHHPVARTLLHLGRAEASAPPLAFLHHLLLSLLPVSGSPHPPPPRISITKLTVDATFCLTHHQPRLLTFLRLTGVLSILSTLMPPTPPSTPSDAARTIQPPSATYLPPATAGSVHTTPSPSLTSPAGPTPSSTTPDFTPQGSPRGAPTTPPLLDEPRVFASPPTLHPDPPLPAPAPAPAPAMPPSPFLPTLSTAPSPFTTANSTLQRSRVFREPNGAHEPPPPEQPTTLTAFTASSSTLQRSRVYREPNGAADLPAMLSEPTMQPTSSASRLTSVNSGLQRSRVFRAPTDDPYIFHPPPSPIASADSLPSSTNSTEAPPTAAGLAPAAEPASSDGIPAPLPPLSSAPLPGASAPGRRARLYHFFHKSRKAAPSAPLTTSSLPPLATHPSPTSPANGSVLDPSLSQPPAMTNTSMYRWWGMRLSNAEACNVELWADVRLPFCCISIRKSTLEVPADVVDVAGSHIHVQAGIGLHQVQAVAQQLGVDARWATGSPPGHDSSPAAAMASIDNTCECSQAGSAQQEEAEQQPRSWMPVFIAHMRADFLQCDACGWLAPRHLRLLLHKPMGCNISLHPRLGRYALDFFNPSDQQGVNIANTTLRTAFSPTGMRLPCPEGGTLEIIPAQLELERGLAFVQLLEKLVVRGLVEQLADAGTVTVWMAPRPIRLVEWEKLLIPRQDVYTRAGRVELHLAVWGKLDLLTRTLDVHLALVAAGLARRKPLYDNVLYFSSMCRAHDAVPDRGSRRCPLTAAEVAAVLADWGAECAAGWVAGGPSADKQGGAGGAGAGTSEEEGTEPDGSSSAEDGASSEGGRTFGRRSKKRKGRKFLWQTRVRGRPEEISLHLAQLGTFLTAYFAASAVKGAVKGVGKSIAGGIAVVLPRS